MGSGAQFEWVGDGNGVDFKGKNLDLGINGDIYSIVPWSEYGADTTLVGFSATTIKMIRYKRIGKTVLVTYHISGTSNTTGFTFTLPFTSANVTNYLTLAGAQATDNGSLVVGGGMSSLPANSDVVTLFADWIETAWTGSGAKIAIGQFQYEVD